MRAVQQNLLGNQLFPGTVVRESQKNSGMGGGAGLGQSNQTNRQQGCRLRELMESRDEKRLDGGKIQKDGSTRVVLDPLAEVKLGVLVAVVVHSGQLMVDRQGPGKGSQNQENTGHQDGHSLAGEGSNALFGRWEVHWAQVLPEEFRSCQSIPRIPTAASSLPPESPAMVRWMR